MDLLFDWLWTHTWWSWPGSPTPGDHLYRAFNLGEMVSFAALGVHVLVRAWKHRPLRNVELVYGVSLLLLSLTDAREALVVQSWLIWAKLALLAQIYSARAALRRAYYPAARV